MLQTFSHRALVAATALALAAGCSGNALTPNQSSSTNQSAGRGSQAMRALPGPTVAGPVFAPLAPLKVNAPAGWPAKKKQASILFASDESTSAVLMYDPNKPNSAPTGSITTGVDVPAGLAVDKTGTLYVANDGNNTIAVYPKGQSSPSLTISSGISGPYGVGVDSKGNVFVSNLDNNTLTAYKAGATSPYATINFSPYGQPVGVGTDGKNNVWVACDTTNAVFEIPAGTTTVNNSGLTDLAGPIGVSFGQKDTIYVSNFSTTNVNIYAYGSTTPSTTITTDITGPTLNGVTKKGLFFQSNQDSNIVGFKKGQTSPFSTLADTAPLGIASSPLVKK
ncbi:MAG: hypothetical protein JOZ77_08900 [Candidatus Eremiobacteraeota bacterium]|nr:hypothetical protein [Candidatus Eremiobacteraeota bacterium]